MSVSGSSSKPSRVIRIAPTGVEYRMTSEDEERAAYHRQHGYEEKKSYNSPPDLPDCAFCEQKAARCGHPSIEVFRPERGMPGYSEYSRAIAPDTPFHVYTDGSGTTRDRPAGAGVVLVRAGVVLAEMSYGFESGTNNLAECRAIHLGLWLLREHVRRLGGCSGYEARATLYSDSEFALHATSPGCTWNLKSKERNSKEPKGSTIAALDCRVLRAKMPRVDFEWIAGHAGHEFNERADQLAGEARKRMISKLSTKSKQEESK